MNGPDSPDQLPGGRSNALGTRLGELVRRARESTSALRSPDRRLELLTVVALIGSGLLILAEFLNLFTIETRDVVVTKQAGGSHHAYAMLVVGVATIGATLLVRSTGLWPPALGIAALGAFALAFALFGDLPDATRSDLVRGARIAEASPALGFWTELVGALLVLGSGLALMFQLRRG
jgi:hypothetical protein